MRRLQPLSGRAAVRRLAAFPSLQGLRCCATGTGAHGADRKVPSAEHYTTTSQKPRATYAAPNRSTDEHVHSVRQEPQAPTAAPLTPQAAPSTPPPPEGGLPHDLHSLAATVPAWAHDSLDNTRRVWRNIESWQRGILTGVGVVMGVGGVLYLLWDTFSSDATQQTKAVASDVLKDKDVRDRAFRATKELVQSVLRDGDAVELLVDVVQRLLAQERSRQSVSIFLQSIFEDHYTQEVTKQFVLTIVQDKWVREQLLVVARDLTLDLLQDPTAKEATTKFLVQTSMEALESEMVQKSGGRAISGAVAGAITPRWWQGKAATPAPAAATGLPAGAPSSPLAETASPSSPSVFVTQQPLTTVVEPPVPGRSFVVPPLDAMSLAPSPVGENAHA
jgi:hypothetical protein